MAENNENIGDSLEYKNVFFVFLCDLVLKIQLVQPYRNLPPNLNDKVLNNKN